MATREELAWAAGFFDGEGCFGSSPAAPTKNGVRRRYLRASLSQKYEPLVIKFCDVVGVGTINFYHARATSSQAFVWRCTSKNALTVAALLWPWLGEQKKADLKRGLRQVRESRVAAEASLAPAARICGAEDCDNIFTPDVRHDAAVYCSVRCFQRIFARERRGPAPPRYCKGCGCSVDQRTRGCNWCYKRHWQRENKAAQGGNPLGEMAATR
jgi:hypothetical protein